MIQFNAVCFKCAKKLTFCQLNLLHAAKKTNRKSNEKKTENKLHRRNSLVKKSVESLPEAG